MRVLFIVGLSAAFLLTGHIGAQGGTGKKTMPTGDEPWVAGHTLSEWMKFYRDGEGAAKTRAAEMIAWCCTQRKSHDAARAMIDVLKDPRHRLIACKALSGMHFDGRAAVPAIVAFACGKDESIEVRCAAFEALGSIGVTRPGVLEALLAGLLHSDDAMRRTAGYAIYRIGPDARPLVPDLIKALKNPSPVVAESAAIALSGIRHDAKDAGPALVEALRHPNFLVRRHVTEALQRLESSDPSIHKALVAALKDENDEVSGGSAWALHFCRDIGPDIVDGLCWALRHGHKRQRYYVANALSELAIDAPQTVEPLILALDDKETRSVAATALGKRRPVTEKTLAALMAAFEKGHYERIAIANALAEMGPAAESTTRRLKEALKEHVREGAWSYELVHVALAKALWKINKDRDMIPILARLANYPYDHHVTNGACLALSEMGPEAKAAAPELVKALKSSREYWAPARALVKIGAPEGEAALREMLASPERDRRLNAAFALWELRRDGKALSELADNAVAHPDRYNRRQVVMTLGKIDLRAAEAELALRAILLALEDDCPYVQKAAAQAVVRLGEEAGPAIRPLTRLLKSDAWSVADQAAQSLGALGRVASKSLPELRAAAENPFLHSSALQAIENIER